MSAPAGVTLERQNEDSRTEHKAKETNSLVLFDGQKYRLIQYCPLSGGKRPSV